MDVATLLGYTLGLGLILWSMSHGGGLSALKLFVHPPAAAVVCGGSFAAILIAPTSFLVMWPRRQSSGKIQRGSAL